MRIKALFTSILLGSALLASAASADPLVRDHRDGATYQAPYGYQVASNGAFVQPYAYGQDPSVEYTPRTSWISFAEDARFSAHGAAVLPVGGQRLTAIELQGERGSTFIQEVRVQLNDGRIIRVNTQRVLDRVHAPNLRVDLGAQASCGIRRVVVIGSGRGQFRMLGA